VRSERYWYWRGFRRRLDGGRRFGEWSRRAERGGRNAVLMKANLSSGKNDDQKVMRGKERIEGRDGDEPNNIPTLISH
jgi:hypothetical protein